MLCDVIILHFFFGEGLIDKVAAHGSEGIIPVELVAAACDEVEHFQFADDAEAGYFGYAAFFE